MKLTRRQFSGSILAGTLASSVSGLSAQQVQAINAVLVGVEHGPVVLNSGASANPNSNTIENYTQLPPATTPVSARQALSVKYLNVGTKQITTTLVNQPLVSPSDQISGVTYLADGSLLVAISPNPSDAFGDQPTRLLTLKNGQVEVVSAQGLKSNQSLDSLLLLSDGSLIGLVVKKSGTGPAQVVDVNSTTGVVRFTNRVTLPSDRRFSCLAEGAGSILYSTVFRDVGTTELWTLDLEKKVAAFSVELTTASPCSNSTCAGFDNMPGIISWYHGVQSLIVTPTGQLLGLCNLEYRLPDSVYLIDTGKGFMTLIVGFAVARTSLSRA